MKKENNKKKVSSVSYTKAGLLSKARRASGNEDKLNAPKKSDESEKLSATGKGILIGQNDKRPSR